MQPDWWVYIVRCQDGSLYTGIARDIVRRVKEHNSGSRGARYTRSRRPVVLVYQEGPLPSKVARQRECEIKSMSRQRKEILLVAGGESNDFDPDRKDHLG